jgi:glucose-6-phosphate 1-dehydrogenase
MLGTPPPSDALVSFGATGDLAYRRIFSSLFGLVRDEGLNVLIVGVAKSGWGLEQLKQRAKDSLIYHDLRDSATEQKLLSLLRYVDGDYDYADPATFWNLHDELREAKPLHYLAVRPGLFGTVAEQLCKSGRAQDARLVIEKPLGPERARQGWYRPDCAFGEAAIQWSRRLHKVVARTARRDRRQEHDAFIKLGDRR